MRVVAILAALCVLVPAVTRAGEDPVRFTTREEGRSIVVTAVNQHAHMPWHATVRFPLLDNLSSSVAPPARFVLPPMITRDIIVLTPIDPAKGTRMKVSYQYAQGDPTAIPEDRIYLFPYEHGTKWTVDQGWFGTTTHQGLHALDFNMEEGTEVHAMRDGVVVGFRKDSDRGGPGPEFEPWSNFVDIVHSDGTWAAYAHLKRDGVLVNTGQTVRAGEPIALSGKTGRASGPHLHVAVYRASWDEEAGTTVPTRFLGLDGEAVTPEEGRTYYAVRPGGPSFEVRLAERIKDQDFENVTRPSAATGEVELKTESVDRKTLVWCSNGTDEAQEVTVDFDELTGMTTSKPLPVVRVVPARTEVFMLSVEQMGRGTSGYRVKYSWRPGRRQGP